MLLRNPIRVENFKKGQRVYWYKMESGVVEEFIVGEDGVTGGMSRYVLTVDDEKELGNRDKLTYRKTDYLFNSIEELTSIVSILEYDTFKSYMENINTTEDLVSFASIHNVSMDGADIVARVAYIMKASEILGLQL